MGTWLINNAADGFGIALTAELLARGHAVAGIVRDEQQRRIYETCFAARPLCYLLPTQDNDALRAVVDEIEALGGDIEALVNNDDGHARRALFDAASLDQVREHFERSVFGAVSLIQAVLPPMRRRGRGHVFNITPLSAKGLWQGSESPMVSITETLDAEMARHGVRATSVTLDQGGHHEADHKAAQAVLLAAVARHPPRRLLLGGRALRDMRRRIGELQDELSDWEMVSLNTGRPGWREVAG
jgi:NAD(P)-dependent dehydrogenase (short-subunit alcohol dehydrogenase family)